MREKFRGWYSPTSAELDALWADGIIGLDANVLLAAYRMPTATRARLFDAVEALGARVWISFQAAREYQENRLSVIAAQRATYDELRGKVRSAQQSLLSQRPDHPVIDPLRFRDLVQRSLAVVSGYIDDVERGHPDVFGTDPLDDAIRDRWDVLLSDCVGEPLDVNDEWRQTASERYARGIPPGFEDKKKPEEHRSYGDLVMWCELLGEVQQRSNEAGHPIPVVFVTDDMKRDWWQTYEGRQLGPRPELVEEMQQHGGMPFWMYRVTRFLDFASDHFGWEPLAPLVLDLPESAETELPDESAPAEEPEGG